MGFNFIFQPKSMEVIVMLGLGLLLVVAYCTAAIAVPSSECQRRCGNIEIPCQEASVSPANRTKMASPNHSSVAVSFSTFP